MKKNKKVCRFCKATKNLHIHSQGVNSKGKWVYYSCKKCSNLRAKKQYRKNPAAFRESVKKYQESEKGLKMLVRYFKKRCLEKPNNKQFKYELTYYKKKLNEKNITKN
jgi:hypothetical protein